MPQIGPHDIFEQNYSHRLKALLSPYGLLLAYDNDRAALDLGLHLYERSATPPQVGQNRIWFQLKGIQATTKSAAELEGNEFVSVKDLQVEHVRYWYAHPEPVYICVYLEASERFIVEDIRDLVDPLGGLPWLVGLGNQKTVTLPLRLTASLERAIAKMPSHRSMRLDGPDYKGGVDPAQVDTSGHQLL